jgi:hypothetical protein
MTITHDACSAREIKLRSVRAIDVDVVVSDAVHLRKAHAASVPMRERRAIDARFRPHAE